MVLRLLVMITGLPLLLLLPPLRLVVTKSLVMVAFVSVEFSGKLQ